MQENGQQVKEGATATIEPSPADAFEAALTEALAKESSQEGQNRETGGAAATRTPPNTPNIISKAPANPTVYPRPEESSAVTKAPAGSTAPKEAGQAVPDQAEETTAESADSAHRSVAPELAGIRQAVVPAVPSAAAASVHESGIKQETSQAGDGLSGESAQLQTIKEEVMGPAVDSEETHAGARQREESSLGGALYVAEALAAVEVQGAESAAVSKVCVFVRQVLNEKHSHLVTIAYLDRA